MLLDQRTASRKVKPAALWVSWKTAPPPRSHTPPPASKYWSGRTRFSSSAAPATTALKVEPGSYWAAKAQLRERPCGGGGTATPASPPPGHGAGNRPKPPPPGGGST